MKQVTHCHQVPIAQTVVYVVVVLYITSTLGGPKRILSKHEHRHQHLRGSASVNAGPEADGADSMVPPENQQGSANDSIPPHSHFTQNMMRVNVDSSIDNVGLVPNTREEWLDAGLSPAVVAKLTEVFGTCTDLVLNVFVPNEGIVPLLFNWMVSMQRVGISPSRVLIVLLGERSPSIASLLDRVNLHVLSHRDLGGPQEFFIPDGIGILNFTHLKRYYFPFRLSLVALLLKAGYRVLMSDADMVFIQNPWDFFEPGRYQLELAYDTCPEEVFRKWGAAGNAGFYTVTPSHATIQYIRRAALNANESLDDQESLNFLLDATAQYHKREGSVYASGVSVHVKAVVGGSPLSAKVLNSNMYITGNVTNLVMRKPWKFTCDGTLMVVFHATSVKGSAKEALMKAYGFWNLRRDWRELIKEIGDDRKLDIAELDGGQQPPRCLLEAMSKGKV